MTTYKVTLEISTDTPIDDWVLGDTLIIDEPYRVLNVKEIA